MASAAVRDVRALAPLGLTSLPWTRPPFDKAAVARILRNSSLLLLFKGENIFKARDYDSAADRLIGMTQHLATLVWEGGLQEFPGIDQRVAEKISALVTNGKLAFYEEFKGRTPRRPPGDARTAG